jgi:hypothetical protein
MGASESSIPPPSSEAEKRLYQRYALWFPVTLVANGHELWAICRDASAGGILVSSVLPLEVGTKVVAKFRVAPNAAEERAVRAEIVRNTANKGDLVLAFPYRLALRFAEPITALPDDLERYSGVAAPSEAP